MSTQIQLHVRSEEMHDEMLRSEGIIGGPLSQLTSGLDYFEEFIDAIDNADSFNVGSSLDDGPNDVADLFSGVTEVTGREIAQVEAIVNDADDLEQNLVEWLEEHEGEEVFSIHW